MMLSEVFKIDDSDIIKKVYLGFIHENTNTLILFSVSKSDER